MRNVIDTTQSCFIVEGNIGAGKTIFLKMVQNYLNVQVVYEPVDKWQNIGGENLLSQFYADKSRWSYTFHTYVFVTHVIAQQEHAKNNPYSIQLFERSVFSDRYCFARNCFEMGSMTALEWKIYQEWFSWLIETHTTKPDGFIYLQADPLVCQQRIMSRSRTEEMSISLEYLERLHKKHEEWLVQKIGILPDLKEIPVLILSCNKDFQHSISEQEKHIEKIIDFVNAIKKNHEIIRKNTQAIL